MTISKRLCSAFLWRHFVPVVLRNGILQQCHVLEEHLSSIKDTLSLFLGELASASQQGPNSHLAYPILTILCVRTTWAEDGSFLLEHLWTESLGKVRAAFIFRGMNVNTPGTIARSSLSWNVPVKRRWKIAFAGTGNILLAKRN